MVHRWIFPLLFLVACTQPTEYARDNPKDPTGAAFVMPNITGLATSRVGRQIRLAWATPFDRYTIRIERSKNGGPFELRDTLQSSITSWTDTQVAMPDSAIYQYRVFGMYLDRSSDTLTSYRITSDLNLHRISSLWMNGTEEGVLEPWWPIARNVILSGDLQTYYFYVDSLTLTTRYPDGSSINHGPISQSRFAISKEETDRIFEIRQFSQGRMVSLWSSRRLNYELTLWGVDGVGVYGYFLPDFAYIQVGSNQLFPLRYGRNEIDFFDARNRSFSLGISGIGEPVVSMVTDGTQRVVYSTQSGAVFSHSLTNNSRIALNAPGPATKIAAYYGSGELVYLQAPINQPTLARLNRFNVNTQTLIGSFPVQSTTMYRIIDRPDLNEIWIFDRGLQRINRTTGAELQPFDDANKIKYLLLKDGKAFVTFRGSASYVKQYDLETGDYVRHTITVPFSDMIYLSDGDHVAYRNSERIYIYRLSNHRIIGSHIGTTLRNQDYFLPENSSQYRSFFYVSSESPHYLFSLEPFGIDYYIDTTP